MKQDIALSAPPVAVVGATYFGYTLPEWAAIVTIIYTVLLAIKLVLGMWINWRKGKDFE